MICCCFLVKVTRRAAEFCKSYESYALIILCFILLFSQGDEDKDDEEDNWPELRYGIYKNPKPGPSWRLEPGEY